MGGAGMNACETGSVCGWVYIQEVNEGKVSVEGQEAYLPTAQLQPIAREPINC